MNRKQLPLLPFLSFILVLLTLLAKSGLVVGGSTYTIHSASEFVDFSTEVNAGTTFASTTVFLDSDIAFTDDLSSQFKPIGNLTSSFLGTFDGQGYTISSLKLESAENHTGLFGRSDGLTIRNLVIGSSCSITSTHNADGGYTTIGSFVGYSNAASSSVIIENCVNMADLTFASNGHGPYFYFGGLVGKFDLTSSNSAIIKNCANYGTITKSGSSSNSYIGGIVGESYTSSVAFISNCINNGKILNEGSTEGTVAIGGILGKAWVNTIEGCINLGEITSSKDGSIGTIMGEKESSSTTTITYCYWPSDLQHKELNGSGNPTISECSRYNASTFELDTFVSVNGHNTNSLIYALNVFADTISASYSHWVLNREGKTVSFNVNDKKLSLTLDSQIILLPNLANEGDLIFDGWYEDSALTTLLTDPEIIEDTKFYGSWKVKTAHTITFDTRGGSPIPKKTVDLGSSIVLPTGLTRDYCEFMWWETGYGVKVSTESITPVRDTTLYAVWKCSHIRSVYDLISFSSVVNSGASDYSGTTVFLDTDLDFSGDLSNRFESVGDYYHYHYFFGALDGQGHIINNLKIKSAVQTLGLFGYSDKAEIRNLILDKSCSVTSLYSDTLDPYIGGFFGSCRSKNGKCVIENSVNMANVTFNGSAGYALFLGGIAGQMQRVSYSVDVSNCANYGSVFSYGVIKSDVVFVGGVIGDFDGDKSKTIQNCLNYGGITFVSNPSSKPVNVSIGGVIGASRKGTPTIKNCMNAGKLAPLTASFPVYIGNVVGNALSGGSISYCYWTGDTENKNVCGNKEGDVSISECNSYNSSTVSELNRQATINNWNRWVSNPKSAVTTFRVNYNKGFSVASQVILLPGLTAKSGVDFRWWYKESNYDVRFQSSEVTESMTLHGLYTKPKITVFLDTDGGSVVPTSKDVAYGDAYGELPIPLKEGYSFAGWYTETPGGTPVNSSSAVRFVSDHTIYAHWKANQYTISFETNGESECDDITQDYNTPVTLPEPNRTGYTFHYWSMSKSSDSEYTGTVMPSKDIRLYAQWVANNYTVKFDAKGISVDKNSENVTFGQAYGPLPEPSNGIGTFMGWRIEGTDKEVDETTIVDIASNHTLYATWGVNIVTLNGTGVDVDPASVSATYGKNYPPLPTPTRTGYRFVGWFLDEAGEEEINSDTENTIPYPHTLYARWNINSYTVAFDFGNGTKTDLLMNYSDLIIYPSEVEKRGYTFTGWTPNTLIVPDQNVLIAAQWKANEYNATLVLDKNEEYSGEEDTVITVTFGERYDSLPEPNRTGYSFLGWFTEEDKLITEDTVVNETEDHLLYAHWEVNKYIITLDANGGDELAVSELEVAFGEKYGTLPTPARDGYRFSGWFNEFNESISGETIMSETENHTLYAEWTPNRCTVTFDVNGGNELPEMEIFATFNESYDELPEATRDGYTFLGWFTEEGEEVTNETEIDETDDHTLYAHWDPNKYVVTLDVNGGDELPEKSLSVTFDSSYGELPVPARTGYTFLGWFTEEGKPVVGETRVKTPNNHTIYVHWEPMKYVVTFDVNRGDKIVGNETLVVFEGTYGELPEPTRAGYKFLGWFTEESEMVTSETIVSDTGDRTLYAHWDLNKYTVTLDVNGGGDEVDVKEIVVTVTSSYGTLPTPTKVGYAFLGWFNGRDDLIASDTVANKILDNHTLYAKWLPNNYTVSLDVDGGDALDKENISVTFDDCYLLLPLPTKLGHTFLGWFSEENDLVTNKTPVTVASNHTLHAHWAPIEYIVSFEANGGDELYKKISIPFKSVYGTLPIPTRTGYVFCGWVNDKGEPVADETVFVRTEDHTLYARWEPNKYKVSFNVNSIEEKALDPIVVTFDAAYGELPALKEKTGHTFAGWTDGIFSASKVNSSSVVSIPSDHTLYAVWVPNKYTLSFDFGDGSAPVKIALTYNDRIIYPNENPTKSFYKFSAWCTTYIDGTEQCNVTHVPAKDVAFTASFDADTSLVAGIAASAVAGVLLIILIIVIIVLIRVTRTVKRRYGNKYVGMEVNSVRDEEESMRIAQQAEAANITTDLKKRLKKAFKKAEKSELLCEILVDLGVNFDEADDLDVVESFRVTDASSAVSSAIENGTDLVAAAGYLALLYTTVRKQEEYVSFSDLYFGMKNIDDFMDKMEEGSISFGGIVSGFADRNRAVRSLREDGDEKGSPSGVLFRVKNGMGYKIGGQYGETDEVLFEFGSVFRIKSVKEVVSGKYLVVKLLFVSPRAEEEFFDL